MEYLEIRGAVTLKPDANMDRVNSIINRLSKIEFSQPGSLLILLKKRRLKISAEGTVSDSHSIRELFTKLQGQLSNSSSLSIERIRWETTVVLIDWRFNLKVRTESQRQLAFAQ